ncbi:OmpA family protein [Roseomonas sp. NAR14]|uniref:OmpA family protein n=1 Tax=Roseomonas acroporae TaxID=2937791 RepID=A0A9X1Y4Y8_9PROT|nr:OmpA family protein [Roseomonas acroporae]MCK8784044.1 OmpA family protein [Roseomonas acroporae]
MPSRRVLGRAALGASALVLAGSLTGPLARPLGFGGTALASDADIAQEYIRALTRGVPTGNAPAGSGTPSGTPSGAPLPPSGAPIANAPPASSADAAGDEADGEDGEGPQTRGVRVGGGAPQQAPGQPFGQPQVQPVVDPGGMQPRAVPAISLTIVFPTGSWLITPAAEKMLAPLGMALTSPQLAPFRFRIEGHTDTVGWPDQNQLLSERRAMAVRDYLVWRYGISPARMVPVGMGSSQLAVPTPDQWPEVRNRRVQILNLGS